MAEKDQHRRFRGPRSADEQKGSARDMGRIPDESSNKPGEEGNATTGGFGDRDKKSDRGAGSRPDDSSGAE